MGTSLKGKNSGSKVFPLRAVPYGREICIMGAMPMLDAMYQTRWKNLLVNKGLTLHSGYFHTYRHSLLNPNKIILYRCTFLRTHMEHLNFPKNFYLKKHISLYHVYIINTAYPAD